MNGRTALGAAVVLLAVLAGALFLDHAQRLVPVYAAARDLPAGTPLKTGDLMVVRVRLPASALRHYLQPSAGRAVTGQVLTAPVRREALVPAELVLASSREAGLVELPVQVDPGAGGRPASGGRGRPGPRGPGRAHGHRAGTRRAAADARRPGSGRGRRHRHGQDLRGQGTGPRNRPGRRGDSAERHPGTRAQHGCTG